MDDTSNTKVQKLLVDIPSDFKFHAAYMAYSKAWDESSLEEAKAKLNNIMSSFKKDESSYEMFYNNIGQYRGENVDYKDRVRIKGQSKKDWRRRESRDSRESRYKG